VADALFKDLYGSNVNEAIFAHKHPTDALRRVSERAGASLDLTLADLLLYVRIGALNENRNDGAWSDLRWSKKKLLAPLLDLRDGTKLFAEGIARAGRPNVGVRHLREWTKSLTVRAPGSVGRPREEDVISLPAGKKFANTGVRLRSEKQRRAFVKKVAALTPQAREAFVKDLKDALGGLQLLLDEVRELDDE
jgi:hypothetical protein